MNKNSASTKVPGSDGLELSGFIIESLPYAYALFDDNERLVLHNSTYQKYSGLTKKILSGKPRLEGILRQMIRKDQITAAREDPESWLKWRLGSHRTPGAPIEVVCGNDRVMRITEQRHDNGFVTARLENISNIQSHQHISRESDKRASEARLKTTRHQLFQAINYMSDSLVMYDADERLMVCNSKFRYTHKKFPETYQVGITISETVRLLAEGNFYGRLEDTEIFIKERIALMKTPGVREILYPQGRWEQVRTSKTRDGGTVMLWSNITNLKKITSDLAQREEHLRAIMETVLDAIITIDDKGKINTFNPAAERIFGYNADQIIGKNVKKLMPQPFRREHDGYLSKYMDTGDAHIIGIGRKVIGQRRDGSTFPMELAVSEGHHADKRMFIGVVRDITEQKAAEDALKLSEERFALAMKASNEGIWDWDIESGKVHLSHRIEKMLEIANGSEVTSKVLSKLSHPEDRKIYKDALIAHLKGETDAFECEFRHVDKNGDIRWIRDRAMALRRPNGRAYRMIGSVGDITKRKLDEEALRDALEQAEIANRTKTDFLANISHELRTPLNAIIGFSDMITEEIFGPLGSKKYHDYSKTINESGHHLLDIINDILDVTRIEVCKLDFNPERVEMAPVFESCLRLIRERAKRKNLSLRRNIQGNLPDIMADPRRLKQILLNLLSNAVKFTPDNGTVTLMAKTTRVGTLVISIKDSGIGMKSSDIPKVMAPFVQVDSKLSRSYDGAGLGLPLTKSFVELHGGDMTIKSAPGKGTTVTICFPADILTPRTTAS